MVTAENRWRCSAGRRRALGGLAAYLAASDFLQAQRDPAIPLVAHPRFRGLDEMKTAFDFYPNFEASVSRAVLENVNHASESESTLVRNRDAFDWVEIVPRSAPVTDVSTGVELFGEKMAYPIFVCPSGNQGGLHPEAESGMHVGATAAGHTICIISNSPTHPLEQIAAAAKGTLWYQHFPQQQERARSEVLGRAVAAGYPVIVVNVDTRALYYERDLHSRQIRGVSVIGGAPRRAVGSAAPERSANPSTAALSRYRVTDAFAGDWIGFPYLDAVRRSLDALRASTKVPIVVKGVLTVEDAQLCIEHGMDGIIVSNHGGRACDYSPSPLEVLPEIADAVKGRLAILVDSGFRRGSDVFKALALGATAVGFGRPSRWALGAFGPAGVERVLKILQAELVETMRQAGRPTLASIDRSAVRTHFP